MSREVRNKARCCVLIPYYNAGTLLLESLSSIDGLAGGEVDCVVVDDGSEEVPAVDVLHGTRFQPLVKVHRLPRNEGIAQALNAVLMGLFDDYCYVARLDCGDVCLDERLRRQMAFLDEHPSYAMLGSWVEFVSPDGRQQYVVRQPVRHEQIMRRMHVNCAFTHPSVMYRSSHVRRVGLYPIDRPAAEDFAYFASICENFRTANLPQVLVQCLLSPGGISDAQRRRQIRSRLRVILDNFRPFSLAPYGLLRGAAQLLTPRTFTVVLRSRAQSMTNLGSGVLRRRRRSDGVRLPWQ